MEAAVFLLPRSTGRLYSAMPKPLSPEVRIGLLLLAAVAAALLLANTGLHQRYEAILALPFTLGAPGFSLTLSLHHWVNDGLMAFFFAMAGIEIKREFTTGHLADAKHRWLPLIGAAGGFVTPALLYAALTFHSPTAIHGWAIPAATDIAFAVALATALKNYIPASLRAFLLALSVIDDLMAIAAIALFYNTGLALQPLAFAGLALCGLAALNLAGVRNLVPYALGGLVLWACVLHSGLHGTLAGVLWAFTLPATRNDANHSPATTAEHALAPWVNRLILPLFALANSGVPLAGVGATTLASPILLGTAAGLVLGKPLGVIAAVWLALKTGVAHKPRGASWGHIAAIGSTCGIGFTMSLFIGALSFPPELQTPVRLGVLGGSLLSAGLAVAFLRLLGPVPRQ